MPFLLAERARPEGARSTRAVKGSLGHSPNSFRPHCSFQTRKIECAGFLSQESVDTAARKDSRPLFRAPIPCAESELLMSCFALRLTVRIYLNHRSQICNVGLGEVYGGVCLCKNDIKLLAFHFDEHLFH